MGKTDWKTCLACGQCDIIASLRGSARGCSASGTAARLAAPWSLHPMTWPSFVFSIPTSIILSFPYEADWHTLTFMLHTLVPWTLLPRDDFNQSRVWMMVLNNEFEAEVTNWSLVWYYGISLIYQSIHHVWFPTSDSSCNCFPLTVVLYNTFLVTWGSWGTRAWFGSDSLPQAMWCVFVRAHTLDYCALYCGVSFPFCNP